MKAWERIRERSKLGSMAKAIETGIRRCVSRRLRPKRICPASIPARREDHQNINRPPGERAPIDILAVDNAHDARARKARSKRLGLRASRDEKTAVERKALAAITECV